MTTEESGEVFVSTLGVPEGGGVGSEGGGGDDVRIEEDNSNSGAESGIGQPNSVVVSSPVAGHQQSGGRVLIVSPTTLYFPRTCLLSFYSIVDETLQHTPIYVLGFTNFCFFHYNPIHNNSTA